MRSLRAAGRTDVGQVRQGNEDALLVRDCLFAVADGMGGHLAGEVASAKALERIEELDGRVFQDSESAVAALRDAVIEANAIVSDLAESNAEYRGMGTTLTAALVEGKRLHIAHVGDSRAYLLRDSEFQQITDDHTLVQHLVDEGQISRAEAETHPQRSIITRAIGVARDVDVDTITIDLRPGDQVLLCSDGLTGVVDDEAIARRLSAADDADATVDDLIARANAEGGPDNITVVLLRYQDADENRNGQARAIGTQATAPITISSRSEGVDDDWARSVGRYGSLARGGPQVAAAGEEEPRQVGAILGRATAIVLALAVLVAAVIGGGQFLLSRSYFVALDGSQVVIYQGIDASIGPLDLARVVERTEITVEDVQEWYRPTLEAGRPATDLSDARSIVSGIPVREEAAEADDTGEPEDVDDADSDGTAAGGVADDR